MEESTTFKATREWTPIPRVSRTTPFGYKVSEEDKWILEPIVLELEALERAKKHLKNYSYRDVAIWLTEVTGRPISYEGLRKRVQDDRHRRRQVASAEHWAKRYKRAYEKAEEILARNGKQIEEDGDFSPAFTS